MDWFHNTEFARFDRGSLDQHGNSRRKILHLFRSQPVASPCNRGGLSRDSSTFTDDLLGGERMYGSLPSPNMVVNI